MPRGTRPSLLRRSGQSTVEYVLVISVLVVALVYVAWSFQPFFEEGYEDLERDVNEVLNQGTMDGSNNIR